MQSKEMRRALEKRLLAHAGDVAFIMDSDYWIEKVSDDGRFFLGDDSVIENGDAGRCHMNSIRNHLKNKDLKVCTGFSMNNGKWIRHSWCVDSDGKVHECTPIKRELYFGAILDEENTILLRRDWDYEFDAQLRLAEFKKPVLQEALREAEDCKYFIRRCIDDDCLIDPEIETRRKDDIDGEEWTDLKGHLYQFKENFFRSIGKSPFQASLTDYKEEAKDYLQKSYPFCFGINLREKPELFYENGINLELEFYAMALGADDTKIEEMKQMLRDTKLEPAKKKGQVKHDHRFRPSKDKIQLDKIIGSSSDSYETDNLYDALKKLDDKHIAGFMEYLMIKDYEGNPDKLFDGTCVDLDEDGNYYVSEGNHRIMTAKALQAVKHFITGENNENGIEFTGTVGRVRFVSEHEYPNGWEY